MELVVIRDLYGACDEWRSLWDLFGAYGEITTFHHIKYMCFSTAILKWIRQK